MRKLIATLTLAALIAACGGNDKREQINAMYDSVMVVHDEAMPMMQDIMEAKKNIRARIVALEQKQDSAAERQIETLQNTIDALDRADAQMMDWMRSFNNQYDTMADDSAIKYLMEEQKEIDEVKRTMVQTLEDAKALAADSIE